MTTRTLRSDDPAALELLAAGVPVRAESWGARLVLDDPTALAPLVQRVVADGLWVGEMGPADLAEIIALEQLNRQDYPEGPATPRPDLEALDGYRFFGARDSGALVGVTAIERLPDRAETAFTSVRATHRGRGVATAVKAASVLALAADGVRVFGTGGAGTNAASLGMNRAVGYQVTERWLSFDV